jgi:hypothetical protein
MDKTAALEALQQGEIDLQGQFTRGSNYTYLAQLNYQELQMDVVYKPVRGEQPLWDFPAGSLAKREVAAFILSEALGWELVPPTVYRRKGPMGAGSCQQFIEHAAAYHYFNFNQEDRDRLRPTVLFDLITNNADRKGSHILVSETDHHIWLIDHGLTFNVEDKLRTVVWDFAGESVPAKLLEDLQRTVDDLQLDGVLRQNLAAYLRSAEIHALEARCREILQSPEFPLPAENRRVYPWPPV